MQEVPALHNFQDIQIHNKIEINISMLKICNKQILYICKELDKYLNTEPQSLSIQIHTSFKICERWPNICRFAPCLLTHSCQSCPLINTATHEQQYNITCSENDTNNNVITKDFTQSITTWEYCNSSFRKLGFKRVRSAKLRFWGPV